MASTMALLPALLLGAQPSLHDPTALVEPSRPAQRPRDVLLLSIDDLRPQLSCTESSNFDKPPMHTPNLCKLASTSLVLGRNQVAMATCAPSRVAMMTGRHATSTRIFDLSAYWRNVTASFTTMPQYFKAQNYITQGFGKIFHGGSSSGCADENRPLERQCGGYPVSKCAPTGSCPTCLGDEDIGYSWTESFTGHPSETLRPEQEGPSWVAVPDEQVDELPLADQVMAQKAAEALRRIAGRRHLGQEPERRTHTHRTPPRVHPLPSAPPASVWSVRACARQARTTAPSSSRWAS